MKKIIATGKSSPTSTTNHASVTGPPAKKQRLQQLLKDVLSNHAGVLPTFPHQKKRKYENLHGVMVSQGNKVLAEAYAPGLDLDNIDPDAVYNASDSILFDSNTPHSLRSVSKTVTAMTIGVMLKQFPHLNLGTKLNDVLPAKYRLEQNEGLTLEDVLAMKTGWEWNELTPYMPGQNSEMDMNRSKDPIKYVLSKPMVNPGKHTYCGGTTAVLACIIKHVTNEDPFTYLYKHLLKPMGVPESQAKCLRYNRHHGYDLPNFASGIHLTLPTMLALGQLILNGGELNGKSMIPKDYVTHMVAEKVPTSIKGFVGYGFQTWIARETFKTADGDLIALKIAHASGNGGQKIMMIPELNLCCATISGNYNLPNKLFPCDKSIKKQPSLLLYKDVLGALGLTYIEKPK